MADLTVVTSDFVKLHISTSKDDISFNEKRFAKDISISNLKEKLELMTGGSSSTMKLEAYNKANKLICPLNEDSALLGSYPLEDGMRLHVIDNFTLPLAFNDTGDVELFELSEEDYAKRTDSVRSFLVQNKLRQYNDENMKKKELQIQRDKEVVDSIQVGARCKVTVVNAPTRLGTVKYAGLIEGLDGYWIGVQYDEPLGKNDGSCKGKKYFDCPANYGAFVKPVTVECGDFPAEDYDLDQEI